MSTIQTIGVVGAGQMGGGIAWVASKSGLNVLLADQSREFSERGKEKVAGLLKKQIDKGKATTEEVASLLDRIHPVGALEELKDVDVVIEAASENPSLKFELFRKLDAVVKSDAIFASNTSSISITEIAAVTKRPEQVAGMHFMNPVPVMKLVEGIRGLQTSDATFSAIRNLSEKMGKVFVSVKDGPGFVVNRILMPMINEAVYALHEGLAEAKDIDTAMKLGTNQPMGPLELADFIGLDTCLAIMNVLHEGLGDTKYRASPLLKQYVAAGWLGRKVGRGFYVY